MWPIARYWLEFTRIGGGTVRSRTVIRKAEPVLVLVVLLGLVAGVAWHFSSVLLRPVDMIQYPDRIRSIRDGEVGLAPSRWAAQPGTWGLRWVGGRATV